MKKLGEKDVTRAALKTLAYRAVSLLSTVSVAWFWFGGGFEAAAGFGLIDAVGNTAVYFFFELAWRAFFARRRKNVGA